MTSTNDEKEVKSYQTSGPKGKTYYIELYKSLELRLVEGGTPREHTQHLCEAWRSIYSLCQHSAAPTHPHLLSWLQRHTARAVLQTQWQSAERKEDRLALEEAISVLIVECRTSVAAKGGVRTPWEAQLVARGEWFKRVINNPWKHPVLNCLLNPDGTPPTNDEVLKWLKEERGVTFGMRLLTLVAEKCDDIAISLATAVMERVRADIPPVPDDQLLEEPKDKPSTSKLPFGDRLKEEAGFTVDVWEMLTDIEFVLLHKRDSSKCIDLAKQTPLHGAYQLIERLQSRLGTSPREKRLWKNSKEVAVLIAQVVIARCMVVPVCSGLSRSALYCCARSLARLLGNARLPAAAAALAAPAPTAAHLHTLAAAVDAQLAQKNEASMKPFVCELYVRALTAGMNELERLKLNAQKDTEARSMEQMLSTWLVQLGTVLGTSDRVKCECALTAFSVHPSSHMYERIKAAPTLPPIHLDSEETQLTPINPEFGSWASDSRSMTNFVKTSETLNMKARQNQANVLSTAILTEGEALGLSAELCQDITVLLSGPRVKTLSWDMDRELLLENCRAYMERTHSGTRALTTDLKYLNLDPADFQHLPEEDDDENNIYYGIEKGYEHLVEFQEPEDIWENAFKDSDKTETCESNDEYDSVKNQPHKANGDEEYEEKPQRKKKSRKVVTVKTNMDEESDPLSIVAEAKRTEKKKERPHSKERNHKKVLPIDPLEINDGAEKKKEKRERKKKEKTPQVHDSPLARLVGMKVKKKTSSQGKEDIQEGLDQCVKAWNNNSDKTDGIELHYNSMANEVQQGFSGLHRPASDNSTRTKSPSDLSRNNSPTFVSEEVKKTISKLLEYRRQKTDSHGKTTNAIIRPETQQIENNISPKAVIIPEIPKSYINKQQSERLQELKQKVDNILEQRRQASAIPSPVIQYASKNCSGPNKPSEFDYNQYNYDKTRDVTTRFNYDRARDESPRNYDTARNDTPSNYGRTRDVTPFNYDRSRDVVTPSNYGRTRDDTLHNNNGARDVASWSNNHRSKDVATPSPAERFMENVNLISIYDKNESSYSRSTPYMPQDKLSNENKSKEINIFLQQRNKNYLTDQKETKKAIKPVSRVTTVIPNFKTPCAKITQQKKPDGSLNTFSRMSYYKNKQTDLRRSNESQQHTVGTKLEGFIMDHLVQQTQLAVREHRNELQNPTRDHRKVPLAKTHPTLTNIEQSKLNDEQYAQNSPVSPPKSSLSEKDQHDLVLLLKQQNWLNKPKNSSVASCSRTGGTDSKYISIPTHTQPQNKLNEAKVNSINIISNSVINPPNMNTKKTLDIQGKTKGSNGQARKTTAKPTQLTSNTTEWESVMNDLLKHKTPCRGPNALDITLNNCSFEKAFTDSLRNRSSIFQSPPAGDIPKDCHVPLNAKMPSYSANKTIKKADTLFIPKHSPPESQLKLKNINEQIDKLVKQNQIKVTKTVKSIKVTTTTKEKLKVEIPRMVIQKVRVETSSNGTVEIPNQMPEVKEKQVPNTTPKQADILSRIPTDYDLIDELMDDDLRKEIGELSSDDESYNAAAQNFLKDIKTNEQERSVEYAHKETVKTPVADIIICENNLALFGQNSIQSLAPKEPKQFDLNPPQQLPNLEDPVHVDQITFNRSLYIPAMAQPLVAIVGANLMYDGYSSLQAVNNLPHNAYIAMSSASSMNMYQTASPINASAETIPIENESCFTSMHSTTLTQSVYSYDNEQNRPLPNLAASQGNIKVNVRKEEVKQTKVTITMEKDVLRKPDINTLLDIDTSKNNERKVLVEVQEKHGDDKIDCKRRNLNELMDAKTQVDHERLRKKRMAILNREINHHCMSPIPLGYSPLTDKHVLNKISDVVDNTTKTNSAPRINNIQELIDVKSPATPDSYKENKGDQVTCRRILLRSSNKIKTSTASTSFNTKPLLDKKSKQKAVPIDVEKDITNVVGKNDSETNKTKRVSKRIRNKSLIPKDTQETPTKPPSVTSTVSKIKPTKVQNKKSSQKAPKCNKLSNNIEKVAPTHAVTDNLFDIETELLGSKIEKVSPMPQLCLKLEDEGIKKSLILEDSIPPKQNNTDILPPQRNNISLCETTLSSSIVQPSNDLTTMINKQVIQIEHDVKDDKENANLIKIMPIRSEDMKVKPNLTKISNVKHNMPDKISTIVDIANETHKTHVNMTEEKPRQHMFNTQIVTDEVIPLDMTVSFEELPVATVEERHQAGINVKEPTSVQTNKHKHESVIKISTGNKSDSTAKKAVPKNFENSMVGKNNKPLSIHKITPLETSTKDNDTAIDVTKTKQDKNVTEQTKKSRDQLNKTLKIHHVINENILSNENTERTQVVDDDDLQIIEDVPKSHAIQTVKMVDEGTALKESTNCTKSQRAVSTKPDTCNKLSSHHTKLKERDDDDDVEIIEDIPKSMSARHPKIIVESQAKEEMSKQDVDPVTTNKSNKAKSFKDNIIIENLSKGSDPTKRVVRITQPNGKTFRGIVRGPVNVDNLLDDPQLHALLVNHFKKPNPPHTILKVNINQVVSREVGHVISTQLKDVTRRDPIETVDLLSDDEEDIKCQVFETPNGKYKVKPMDRVTFEKHQSVLSKKCYIHLKKCDAEQESNANKVSSSFVSCGTSPSVIVIPNKETIKIANRVTKELCSKIVGDIKKAPGIPKVYVQGILSEINNISDPGINKPVSDPVVLIDDSSNDSANLTTKPTEKIYELRNMLLKDLGMPSTLKESEDIQVSCSSEAIDLTGDSVMNPADSITEEKTIANINLVPKTEFEKIITRKCVVKLVRCDYTPDLTYRKKDNVIGPETIEITDESEVDEGISLPCCRRNSFSLIEGIPVHISVDQSIIDPKIVNRSSPVMEIYDAIALLTNKITTLNSSATNCLAEWANTKRIYHFQSLSETPSMQSHTNLANMHNAEKLDQNLTEYNLTSLTFEVPKLATLALTYLQNENIVLRYNVGNTTVKRKLDQESIPDAKISKLENIDKWQSNNSQPSTYTLDLSVTRASDIRTIPDTDDHVLSTDEIEKQAIDSPISVITDVTECSDIEDMLLVNTIDIDKITQLYRDNEVETYTNVHNVNMLCHVEVSEKHSKDEMIVSTQADTAYVSDTSIIHDSEIKECSGSLFDPCKINSFVKTVTNTVTSPFGQSDTVIIECVDIPLVGDKKGMQHNPHKVMEECSYQTEIKYDSHNVSSEMEKQYENPSSVDDVQSKKYESSNSKSDSEIKECSGSLFAPCKINSFAKTVTNTVTSPFGQSDTVIVECVDIPLVGDKNGMQHNPHKVMEECSYQTEIKYDSHNDYSGMEKQYENPSSVDDVQSKKYGSSNSKSVVEERLSATDCDEDEGAVETSVSLENNFSVMEETMTDGKTINAVEVVTTSVYAETPKTTFDDKFMEFIETSCKKECDSKIKVGKETPLLLENSTSVLIANMDVDKAIEFFEEEPLVQARIDGERLENQDESMNEITTLCISESKNKEHIVSELLLENSEFFSNSTIDDAKTIQTEKIPAVSVTENTSDVTTEDQCMGQIAHLTNESSDKVKATTASLLLLENNTSFSNNTINNISNYHKETSLGSDDRCMPENSNKLQLPDENEGYTSTASKIKVKSAIESLLMFEQRISVSNNPIDRTEKLQKSHSTNANLTPSVPCFNAKDTPTVEETTLIVADINKINKNTCTTDKEKYSTAVKVNDDTTAVNIDKENNASNLGEGTSAKLTEKIMDQYQTNSYPVSQYVSKEQTAVEALMSLNTDNITQNSILSSSESLLQDSLGKEEQGLNDKSDVLLMEQREYIDNDKRNNENSILNESDTQAFNLTNYKDPVIGEPRVVNVNICTGVNNQSEDENGYTKLETEHEDSSTHFHKTIATINCIQDNILKSSMDDNIFVGAPIVEEIVKPIEFIVESYEHVKPYNESNNTIDNHFKNAIHIPIRKELSPIKETNSKDLVESIADMPNDEIDNKTQYTVDWIKYIKKDVVMDINVDTQLLKVEPNADSLEGYITSKINSKSSKQNNENVVDPVEVTNNSHENEIKKIMELSVAKCRTLPEIAYEEIVPYKSPHKISKDAVKLKRQNIFPHTSHDLDLEKHSSLFKKIRKCYPVKMTDKEKAKNYDDEISACIAQQCDGDLKLIIPEKTYSKSVNDGIDRSSRVNKRKKDMSDCKTSEKKYRKGKNIDYPKTTALAIASTHYAKEFKQIIDYCSSVKFSYARPFHIECIDVCNLLKDWPRQDPPVDVIKCFEKIEDLLFIDTEDINNDKAITDPLQQTLNEEIMNGANISSYNPIEINETNFSMGFGEMSGRVIKEIENGITGLSAATLSDVKQYQPCLTSESNDANPNDSYETDNQKVKILHFMRQINLKEKIHSFFKKTEFELTNDLPQIKKCDSDKNKCLSMFPFGLTSTDYLSVPQTETIVNVVQVGHSPVSASAQNPVMCDPRVTQVSDASPSRCSDDSPGDSQAAIETEYTELKTAVIPLPKIEEYAQHHESPTSQDHASSATEDDSKSSTQTLSIVKIELMEESSQEKSQENEIYDNFSPLPNSNIDYSFEETSITLFNNNTDSASNVEKTSTCIFNAPANIDNTYTNIYNTSSDSDNTFTKMASTSEITKNTHKSSDNTPTITYNIPNIGDGSTEIYTPPNYANSPGATEKTSDIFNYTVIDKTPTNIEDNSTIVNNTDANLHNSISNNASAMDNTYTDMYNTSNMSHNRSGDMDNNVNIDSTSANDDNIVENRDMTPNASRENTDYEYSYENYTSSIVNNNTDINGAEYAGNADNYPNNGENYAGNGNGYSTNVENYPSNGDYATSAENYVNNVDNFTSDRENYMHTNVESYSTDNDNNYHITENTSTNIDSSINNPTADRLLEEPQDLSTATVLTSHRRLPTTQEAKMHESLSEPHKQTASAEKRDQIAHAMNAAGITSESAITTGNEELANLISQSVQSETYTNSSMASNNLTKSAPLNVMTLQQALAQVLPPPLKQTDASENNQMTTNSVAQQVLHIVQGNNAQTVINKPNGTHLIHLVRNKTPSSNGLSLADASLQQGGNQLIHIVNNGSQNAGQFLKRVNVLTNLANVQGSNEQKMIQFVCKSAGGKSIQLNTGNQQSMVLRLHPTAVQASTKPTEFQDTDVPASNIASNSPNQDTSELKSRSVYEENYAQFIHSSTPGQHATSPQNLTSLGQNTSSVQEKATSLPKFNQVFGKQSYQENTNEINHSGLPDETDCQPEENDHIEHPSESVPPLLVRTIAPETASPPPPNLVQQIKQTISPMTMHGGVIYTRQIPVNLGGGQTINLITVPSTEREDSNQTQEEGSFGNPEDHSSIIKLVPHQTSSPNVTVDNTVPHPGATNDLNQNTQPVLTQMRIKLPMLSKAPHIVPGARLVGPSFFQIQRNVIGGTNSPVYQQLVLTTAPSHSIRVPATSLPGSQQPSPSPQAHTSQCPPVHNQTAQTKAQPVQQPQSEQKQDEPGSELSTLTLEQLREFDMVLEQVKERSIVNPLQTFPTCPKSVEMPLADSTDTTATTTSVSESTQEVMYSVENNQPSNVVSYLNRKSTITSATTSYVRSPDSSGIVDTPSSSTQVHITHTVTQKTSDGPSVESSDPPRPKKKKKKSSSASKTITPLNTISSPSRLTNLKPQEDEQTTQRILYILAEYKEQVENSPDKNKPAPRRRNQFPSTSGKRKRGHCSSRSACKRESSPIGENGEDSLITLGSEDSSCGTTFSECTDCQENHSPEDSSHKVVRRLTFEQETTTQTITQTRTIPQRNVIVGDGQTITVARTTTTANTNQAPATTTLLMPANYLLPVSMIKGGQQIAIMTNRGPRLLVGAGDANAGALLFQRIIGPGLKPVLARPGVRHIRLPTAALHNIQTFNIQTTPMTQAQPPDSTAVPAPGPPDLVDTRATTSPWQERGAQHKPDRVRGPSPDCTEPWNLPSSSIAEDYGYEEIVRTDNMERTVLDTAPDRYSPDMEAQRIFDKMFDVDSKKSMYDSPRCGFDIDASDDDKPFQQVVQQRKDGKSHRVTHVSTAALRHKYAILEHELRLQKSLSEECEDLGVDSPSASELFPEADILFGAPSPAHEQTIEDCHTPPPIPMPPSIPQPDMDDQIATDQLLSTPDRHDDLDLNLDDVGEMVTVGEDGIATINPEEFAKSHPNTTFHTEPEDGEISPFTIAPGIKGRHITFHTGPRVSGTVVMAPQTTVISQATINPQTQTVKFANIDNIINSMPSPQPPPLLKEPPRPLSKFDTLLQESREMVQTNTVLHGNGTQVIRRLRYDERNTRTQRSSITDETKMRNDRAMVESMGDNASSPGQPELFWDSTTTERHERRFHFGEEKVVKSPFDELLNDSSAYGPHTRLDSVIKAARPERTSFQGVSVSGSSDESRPLRTYPPKRVHTQHTQDLERHFTLKTTTTTMHHESDRITKTTHHHELDRKKTVQRCQESEGRRRASGRGVVKRPCSCCNGPAPVPPKKRSRPRKPPPGFTST